MATKKDIWYVSELLLIDDEWKSQGLPDRLNECLGDDWKSRGKYKLVEVTYRTLKIDSESNFCWVD